jgi:predicted ArsR family transcriptional regulator
MLRLAARVMHDAARRRRRELAVARDEVDGAAVLAAIAARLGVPRNTVRSRLQRGLARLRERLDADGDRAQWAAPLGGRPCAGSWSRLAGAACCSNAT